MENRMMTAKEAAKYMSISVGHLYKLTMRKEIPFHKPTCGKLYFDSEELCTWMHTNKKGGKA